MTSQKTKVALITGAARRIGATIVRTLHSAGFNVVLHYNNSRRQAKRLAHELNSKRKDSLHLICADLAVNDSYIPLLEETHKRWNRLDVIINNASSFYPTPIGTANFEQWDDLLASNLKAPYFLSQKAATYLAQTNGCIINISDIYAQKPLRHYSIYCIAKAGLDMLTKSLAKELAPKVRVNGIAPSAILWPEANNTLEQSSKDKIIKNTLLKHLGNPKDIANAVLFLIHDAEFITGQIINVDGGRLLN